MMSDEEADRSLFQLKMNLSLIPPNHPCRCNLADFLKEQYEIPKVLYCELCNHLEIENRIYYLEHVTGITHWKNVHSAGLKFARSEYEMLLRAIHQTAPDGNWKDFDLERALQLKGEIGDQKIIPFFPGIKITEKGVDQRLTREEVDLLTRKALYGISKVKYIKPMAALIRRVFNMDSHNVCQFCKLTIDTALKFIKHVLSEEHVIIMEKEGRSFEISDYVLLQRAIQASDPASSIEQNDADFLTKDGTVPCAATIKTYPFMRGDKAEDAPLTQNELKEFTKKIRQQLNRMTDDHKSAFAKLLKERFDIPNIFPCVTCRKFINNPLHYIHHVCSKWHLEKALKEPRIVFTGNDYRQIQKAIVDADRQH
ncbi:hypothetical protein WR25_00103 [Diploscapter pachys]|uniref:Uncharacterized protein n=1 Tax=Diploscapter pachys TaxID=2018661 RepID=A0A2A2J8T8_9BILA|nr:hypothetical protein WR25_00103 [Diploscapter pachys]